MKPPTPTEKRFQEFLTLLKSIDINELKDIDEILRREEREGLNVEDDEQWSGAVRVALEEAIPEGDHRKSINQFIFDVYSINESDARQYAVVKDSGGGINADVAYQAYKIFFLNATIFKHLMAR